MSDFLKNTTTTAAGQHTLVCIDCSYSTESSKEYWNKVIELVNAHEHAEFILWGSDAERMSRASVLKWAKDRRARGGTSPQCFIPFLENESRLILVTDGQVSNDAVTACDQLMQDKQLAYVEVYFLDTGGSMNLSVSAPFTRSCEYRIFVGNSKLADGSSNETVDLSPYYDNPSLFLKEAEKLLNLVVMQNLGRLNQPLRNELLDLQKNLLAAVAKSNSDSIGDVMSGLRELLAVGEYDQSIVETRRLAEAGDSSIGRRVETACQELVRAVSGSNDFSFTMLQPGRLDRAAPVAATAVEDLPPVESCASQWQCPIQLSEDFPLLLVADGTPVFEGMDKAYLDQLITSPLMVLSNPELVEKIRLRLDHPIGLEAIRHMFSLGEVVSPCTRRPVSCAISLGDDSSHSVATNFALANIFFGNKLVGLPELWLAVVYFVAESTTYLSEASEFMNVFRGCMLRVMRRRHTNITLTGLPVEPMIKAPIDIAIWYCVVSPHVVNNWTTTDDARNRLRSFGSAAPYLLRLVDMFGYPYDRAWTLRQLSLYKAFAWMMREENDHESQWRNLLRAQYQNSMTMNDQRCTLILLDGEAGDNKPKLPSDFRCCPQAEAVSLPELLALAELVDRQKSVGVINIPYSLGVDAYSVPAAVYNYDYHLHPNAVNVKPELCRNTFRPVVVDRKRRMHWAAASEECFGPLSRQISLYNWFIKFVLEHQEYPTTDGFVSFLAKKQAHREDGNAKDTLPADIITMVDTLFANYETVLGMGFADISVHEFNTVAYGSMREVERAQLDGSDTLGVV